jgi:hypothetical protein
VRPIFTSNTPIESVKQGEKAKSTKFLKCPIYGSKGARESKTPPVNNISIVPSIFTSSTPIDSAKQGEQIWKFSNFSNFQSRWEINQFLSKTPILINFLTVRPIYTISKPIGSAKQGKKLTHEYFATFQSRGASEQFLSKNFALE